MSIKKILFVIMAAMFLTLLSGVVFADTNVGSSYVLSQAVDIDGIKAPSDTVLDFSENDNEVSGDAGKLSKFEIGGTEYTGAEITYDKGNADFKFDFEPQDLSDYGTAAIGFYLHDSSDMPIRNCRISLIMGSSSDSYSYSCKVSPNCSALFFADISGFSHRDSIDSFKIKISYDVQEGNSEGTVYFTELFLMKDGDFSANKSLGASSINADKGEISIENKALKATPFDGTAVIEADISKDSLPECYSKNYSNSTSNVPVVYAEITVTGKSGTISGEFQPQYSSDAPDGSSVNLKPASPVSQTISKVTFSYFFRISQPELKSYKITLKSSDNSSFIIRSVKFHYTHDNDLSAESMGSITKIAVSDGIIHVEGKLKKSASVEYINSDIGLYTVPATGGEPVLIEKIKASSKFTFDIPESSYPHAAAENYFYVCIIDKDGNQILASKKQFVSSSAMPEGNNTVFGLHSADAVGVFESNASRVIVDVNLDRLTGGDAGLSSGTACSRGSGIYYLDTSYLKELDKDIKFYASSDVGIYLRFTSNKPLRWLSLPYNLYKNNAGPYDPNKSETHGIQLYMAIVSFLCERYPNTVSIILSSGINSNPINGETPDSLWNYACGTALLARLVYGAASEKIDNFFVTIPFAQNNKNGFYADPTLLSALISEELYSIGQIPWTVMYSSSGESFGVIDAIMTSGRANLMCFPSSAAACFIPDSTLSFTDIVQNFSDICKSSKNTETRAVFLSLSNVSEKDSSLDYSAFKPIMSNGENSVSDDSAFSYDALNLNEFTGQYCLWDFTDSYNTLGWTVGSGIDTCATYFKYGVCEYSGKSGNPRVLRCRLADGSNSSYGIILCTLSQSMSFTLSPYVVFDFSVNSDTPSDITFIFGKDDNRVEFHSSYPAGKGDYKMVCNLEDYALLANDINYVSIMVCSDSVVTLDVSKITGYSKSSTAEDIALKFDERIGNVKNRNTKADKSDSLTVLISVCAVTFICSLWAVIHCYRTDKERKLKNNKIL